MTQRQCYLSIALFGGQLVGNLLRTNFSKIQVLMHYGVSDAQANTHKPMDLVHELKRHRLYSPYTAFIRRCISRPPTPSDAKNRITLRCSFFTCIISGR
ncbi:uncharacterized protein TNCV_2964301 [Trichonephila clavipes]|nr:uncharacterized protein TNCV_2964301 [Trichonephila clavipes]